MAYRPFGRAMPAPTVNVGATIGRPPWLPPSGGAGAQRLRGAYTNLSVICFANATVSLRLGHGAGLTAHWAVIQHRAAASLPFRGGGPPRWGRADEGIGSYRVRRKIGEAGGQSRPPLQELYNNPRDCPASAIGHWLTMTLQFEALPLLWGLEREAGMTYYHASPTGGLQILEPRKSPFLDKPTQVCMTSLRAMALFYLIRNYEYAYGYDRQGRLYFDDPFPEALKRLYSGKSGWLYVCRDGEYEKTAIPNEYISYEPVYVVGAEWIPDAWQAFLEEQKRGNIRIYDYAYLKSEPEKFAAKCAWLEREISKEIIENHLWDTSDADRARYYQEHYPEIWGRTLVCVQTEEEPHVYR